MVQTTVKIEKTVIMTAKILLTLTNFSVITIRTIVEIKVLLVEENPEHLGLKDSTF